MSGQELDHRKKTSFNPAAITRPDPELMKYFVLSAVATGPGIFVTLPMLYFKYHTLRYRFDDRGVSMSWGILFRREIYLTYRRIQDIHLTRNIIQRWMGLATINIQTASGGSGPEMSIEGILEVEQLRDYLYSRMRGSHGIDTSPVPELTADGRPGIEAAATPDDQAVTLLTEIRDLLRQVNEHRQESAS